MKDEINSALLELTRQRQAELEESIAAWLRETGAKVRLWCGPGCGNCCSLTVNVSFPEALLLASQLTATQKGRLDVTVAKLREHARQSADARSFLTGYRAAVGPCPFLDASANCSVYPARPLSCRALLATRPSDWCGVNLGGLDTLERDAFLASLDRSVVAWPTHYAAAPQEHAAELERGLVFAMFRTHGFGVTGTLPLLTHLAGQSAAMTALAAGAATFRDFLAGHGYTHPFLVQIHEP